MVKSLRFGIIGLGKISKLHITAIDQVPGAELVAVHSRSESKTQAAAAKLGVHGYSTLGALLTAQDVDVVCVLTPPATHAEIGIKAAIAGKHVIVEKPIDLNENKAKNLIRACKENNVKLTVISQMRFGKAVSRAKKILDEGKFGNIFLLRASLKWNRSEKYYESQKWLMKGGGVLHNQGIHLLDLLSWFGGEVETSFLQKRTVNYGLPVEDTAVAVLNFKNKALGILEATTASCRNFSNELEIHGTNGSIVIRNDRIVEYHFGEYSTLATVKSRLISKGMALRPMKKGHIADQLVDFVNAVRGQRDPFVRGEAGLATLQICNQLVRLQEKEVNKNDITKNEDKA